MDDPRRRSGRRTWAFARFAAGALVLAALGACGLRITNDPPTYEQLDPPEQEVVDVVLEELSAFNVQVEQRTPFSIATVVDRDRINVSFEGAIFNANVGDDTVHVAVWENLSDRQKSLVGDWFEASDEESARETYERLFYRFMAVSQGVKQYMYEALTTAWVFSNRSLFNVERDSARVAIAHFNEAGRPEMVVFVSEACAPVLEQYEPVYGETFGKSYLANNVLDLADPDGPSGYMYYLCRWVQMGQEASVDLSTELDWIANLPQG